MNAIRWIFFLTLTILVISSCNNASAQFRGDHAAANAPHAAPARALP